MSLADHDLATLQAQLTGWGHPPSHATKILRQFYDADGEPAFDRNIGNHLRSRLSAELLPLRSRITTRHESTDGTVKLLIGFEAGGAVEAVLMPTFRAGIAAGCISSQIGCAMGCDFCASTKDGLQRNLTTGEIVEQFLHLRRSARFSGSRLRTIVFMGMGEPLMNLDNVAAAIRRIADGAMGSLGFRQITVSTVGVVPAIDRLAEMDLNIHLALSLHAPDDETRSKIVPLNRKYPIAEVMDAARRYYERVEREVNIEYCLLAGVNDSLDQAHLLAELMQGFRAHVNLIPYNAIGAGLSGMVYGRPSNERVSEFLNILRDAGVCAHVRATRGDDVSAACGQLAITSSAAG